MLIDTHCHLNFKALRKQVGQVIERAAAADVHQMVVVGADLKSSRRAVAIAKTHWPTAVAAVGLHPHHVYEYQRSGLAMKVALAEAKEQLELLLSEPEVLAVGEIGFDAHQYAHSVYGPVVFDDTIFAWQQAFFEMQLKLAITHQKPVIMHNRDAVEQVLEFWESHHQLSRPRRQVLHCCEPDLRLLRLAEDHDWLIGVDGDLTFDPAKQDFIRQVPLKRLVLETDAPYILPEPERSASQDKPFSQRLCEPRHVRDIATFLAQLKKVSLEEVAAATTGNAQQLFGLPSVQ